MTFSRNSVSLEKRLIVLRHEITQENKLGIIQGQSIDGTLIKVEVDERKVEWCVEHILTPVVIVSSDAKRSEQSARYLSEALNIPIQVSSLFRQRCWGNIEGKTIDKLGSEFVRNAYIADIDELASGAESIHDICQRAKNAWHYLRDIDVRTVIVVTHDEFGNYLTNEILRESLFKRPLSFNEGHIIDLVDNKVSQVVLHITVIPVSVEHVVILRSDAVGFTADELGLRILRNRGIDVKIDTEGGANDLESAEGVIVGDRQFTDKDLRNYPNLKVISRFGKGTYNIQMPSDTRIYVTNTPGCNERGTVEFSVAVILNLIRHISDFNDRILTNDVWPPRFLSKEWSEICVGVIGLGPIGKNVSQILKSMGFSVIVWTFHPEKYRYFLGKEELQLSSSIDELLFLADVVALHVRASSLTRGLIGIKELEIMKARRPYLVNSSRAEVLDYRALKLALENNWISGVALDVWPEEPIKSGWLRELASDSRVIATPHIACATKRAINKAISLCAYNVDWVLSGIPELASCVSLEELFS